MNTPCKLFEGFKEKFGYGHKSHKGKNWMAHRLAWYKVHGDIPKGLHVRHMCHNPSCVNPDHLVLGTHQDNMDDMVKAGRQLRGEKNSAAKLTEAQAREIYAQKPLGRAPIGFAQHLANKYGVSKETIGRIWRKERWQHIHEQT